MRLLVSAMEPSANLHLRELVKHLKGCELSGIFDERLGVPLYSPERFSVMGFIDTFFKIRLAKKAMKEMVVAAKEAEKVLLIDAPAFNLPLAKELKKVYPNKEIIYYILPKVWAWKAKRAKKVMAYTDRQLSIFPFESRYYPHSTYVGNPITDEISAIKGALSKGDTLAFLPGSRSREIRYLMPILREVREKLTEKRALLVIPEHFSDAKIAALYGDISMFEVQRDTQSALYASSYAFVCSGTATLECAYIGTPFVLLYRSNPLEIWLARRFVKLPFVGLANLLFYFDGKPPMHPELLQEEVHSERLLQHYLEDDKEAFFERVKTLRGYMGGDCAAKVAAIIQN